MRLRVAAHWVGVCLPSSTEIRLPFVYPMPGSQRLAKHSKHPVLYSNGAGPFNSRSSRGLSPRPLRSGSTLPVRQYDDALSMCPADYCCDHDPSARECFGHKSQKWCHGYFAGAVRCLGHVFDVFKGRSLHGNLRKQRKGLCRTGKSTEYGAYARFGIATHGC